MPKYVYAFFRRISKDFKQKELLPVKALFFIQMSTILVLYPYLTIHMRELGINVEETAIMSAVTPVVGILMPPLAGMMADKIGNFRVLLAGFSAVSGIAALLLLLIPVGRIRITYPNTLVMGVSCNADIPLDLLLPQEYPCTFKNNDNHTHEVDIKVESCGFVCPVYADTDDGEKVLQTKKYDVHVFNTQKNEIISISYNLTGNDVYVPTIISETRSHEILKANDRYRTAIRKFSENAYFFPSSLLYNLKCRDDGVNFTNNVKLHYKCSFSQKLHGFNESLKVGMTLNPLVESDKTENVRNFTLNYIKNGTEKRSPLCEDGFGSTNYKTKVQVHSLDEVLDLENCVAKCIATTPRAQFCSNAERVIEFDTKFTFWTYLSVRVFVGIIGGTAYTMFEGAVIAILREYRADYGLQRMYASVGGMISSPLAGWIIDYSSRGKGYTDFRPVFYLYAILKVLGALMMFFINLEFKTPATSVVSDVIKVLNVELVFLFIASFLLGCAWGYIESFLFWLIQDLGGSKSLMGLTITVAGVFGIPLLACSGPLIKRVGHVNIIFIGFIAYAVRLVGYSVIYNPWYSLIFEALECVTHSLCFTAAVTYAARLSTVTTDTTIQGIFGGLFYGVGKSCGSLIGGYLIGYVGMRRTFQIFALVTGIAGILYVLIYHLFLKKRSVLTSQKAPPVTEPEKPPPEFQDVDLTTAANASLQQNDIVDKIKSVPYEDSLINLGFEDNEFDAEATEKDDVNLDKLQVAKCEVDKANKK